METPSSSMSQIFQEFQDLSLTGEALVSAGEVASHLQRYGLTCKDPRPLAGSSVLGLAVSRPSSGLDRRLVWKQPEAFPTGPVSPQLTKRELFSLCGKVAAHLPVAGWTRVASSFAKRLCEGEAWKIPSAVRMMADIQADIAADIAMHDPAQGVWNVDPNRAYQVFCDTSLAALAVVIKWDNRVMEDKAWLRKKDDFLHINVAEVTAITRGVNLASRWKARRLAMKTKHKIDLTGYFYA